MDAAKRDAARSSGRPLVSVVIPNHDYGHFLPGCLESLLGQALDPGQLEVVFVDDLSADGSLELARQLLPGLGLCSWQVLALPRVGCPGPVRNAGLAAAQGEFLLPLDPDDLLLPDFLARTLAALEASGADVAYGGYFEEADGQAREVRPPDFHPLLLANQSILPATALFRRRLWDLGARYRSATAYEDWDFWIQAALLGARFVRVDGPLYRHRLHGANYSGRARLKDGPAKARIVLDNPAFFPACSRAWARGLLRGEAWAQPLGRGLIPVFREHTGLPEPGRSSPDRAAWTSSGISTTLTSPDKGSRRARP